MSNVELTSTLIDSVGGDPTARAAAAAAQGTANTAVTNAATAQTTANTAVTNAATAQTTANAALPAASFTSAGIDGVGGDPTARASAASAGSIIALGDSITANSNSYETNTTGLNSWYLRGPFASLISASGGILQPVDISRFGYGWPYTGSGNSNVGWGALIIVSGGSGYSNSTTASVQATVGVTGATVGLTITGGVITGATITAAGTGYFGQAPIITITDPLGTGSGALILAQVAKAGEFAAGGIGSAEALGYVPMILNGGSPIARNALVMIGTNDNARGLTLAQSQANITAICKQLLSGGVRPFFTLIERGGSAGAAAQSSLNALRRWAHDYLPVLAPGTIVIDASPYYANDLETSSANPIPAAYSTDQLHPTTAGGWVIGKILWSQMVPYFGGFGVITTGTAGDNYDATYNMGGNLTSQKLVRAAGGTAVVGGESPWTGTKFSNLWLSRLTGGTGTGTIAASIVARSDGKGGSYQVLTVNVTGAAAGEVYRLTWSSNGTANTSASMSKVPVAGERIVASIDEVILSNVVNMKGARIRLVALGASGATITPTSTLIGTNILTTSSWNDYIDTNFPAFSGEKMFAQTREMVVPAGTSYLTMHMDFVVNAAGAASFTANLYGAAIRYVQ